MVFMPLFMPIVAELGHNVVWYGERYIGFPESQYILGLEGAIEADMWTGVIYVQRVGHGTPKEVCYRINLLTLCDVYQVIDVNVRNSGHGGGDAFLVNDLISAMTSDAQPKATGQEGIMSAVACIALEQAMQQRQVVDVEPYWKQLHI